MIVRLNRSIAIGVEGGVTWGIENQPKNKTLWVGAETNSYGKWIGMNLRPKGISPLYELTIDRPRVDE